MENFKFEIIQLDIWGNKTEGFEVNAAYNTGRTITVDNLNDKTIVSALKNANELNKKCRNFVVNELGQDINGRWSFAIDHHTKLHGEVMVLQLQQL